MRIDRIELRSWMVHPHLDLDLAPLTLVSAPNGRGKSSVRDALAFCLLGTVPRDLPRGESGRRQLVTRGGARNGAVTLHAGAATLKREVVSGRTVLTGVLPIPADAPQSVVPYLLNAAAFRTSEDARRELLFRVTRTQLGLAAIKAVLMQRNVAPPDVLSLLRLDSDLDAWRNRANRLAAEGRGAWKAATGENYGSEKGKTWSVPVDHVTPAEEAAATARLRDLQQEQMDVGRELGALDEAEARRERDAARRAKLQASVDAAAALPLSAHDLREQLVDAEARLKAVIPPEPPALRVVQRERSTVAAPASPPARAPQPTPQPARLRNTSITCPTCHSFLTWDGDGNRTVHLPPNGAPA